MAGFGADDRDSGLHRVSRLTKWLVAGSVAGIGAVTAVVASAAPGSSRTNPPAPAGPAATVPATTPATTPITSPATPPSSGVPGTVGTIPPTVQTSPPFTDPPLTDPPLPPVRHHHVSSGGS